jgi:nucleoside-diphosphate-sugar epimerase
LVSAILAAIDHPATRNQLFNVCMDEPVDYGALADYLRQSRQLDSIDISSEYHSTWLDNAKARATLNWRPHYDLKRLVDAAWAYKRAADDPRKVWYPG